MSSSNDILDGMQGVNVSQRLMRRWAAIERAACSSTAKEAVISIPLWGFGGGEGVNDGLRDGNVLRRDPGKINDGDIIIRRPARLCA